MKKKKKVKKIRKKVSEKNQKSFHLAFKINVSNKSKNISTCWHQNTIYIKLV